MKKCLILLLFLVLYHATDAQGLYDSLRLVYSDTIIWAKKHELKKSEPLESYLEQELKSIQDPKTNQLATLAIIFNLYDFGWIDSQYLSHKLKDIIEDPIDHAVNELANSIQAQITTGLVNTKIKDIELSDSQGSILKIKDFYPKHAFLIVDLWATYCGPCIAEMKNFNRLRKEYNIEFYSISFDNEFERVQKFVMKKKNYTWPIVYAGRKSDLWEYFRIRQIPAYFIVDNSGTIVSKVFRNKLEEEIADLYKDL